MGIPTISFKLPVRSWRPKCWMAIPEAWPDPNPTTMPLFTYLSTYKTTRHVYKNHSSPNNMDNYQTQERGYLILTKYKFFDKYTSCLQKNRTFFWHWHNNHWLKCTYSPCMDTKTENRKIWMKLDEYTAHTMGTVKYISFHCFCQLIHTK